MLAECGPSLCVFNEGNGDCHGGMCIPNVLEKGGYACKGPFERSFLLGHRSKLDYRTSLMSRRSPACPCNSAQFQDLAKNGECCRLVQ